MKTEFDIQLQAKDLFRFNIRQTYSSMHGWISIALTILIFVMAGITTYQQGVTAYTFLYSGMGIVLAFYIPVTLWSKANITMKKNEVLSGKLHFEISEKNIRVTQGEDSGELPWEQVYKMISNKKQVLIYSNRINAYIIPREQVVEQYDVIKQIAESKLEKYRVNMK